MPRKYSKKFSKRETCSAINCKRYRSTSDVSFYRFPKEPRRCAKWVQNLQNAALKGISWEQLHESYWVCSAHFDDRQFKNQCDERCGLKWNAVPTIIDVPNPKLPRTRKARKTRTCPLSDEEGHHQGGDQRLKTKSRRLPSQESLGMGSSTQHNGLDTDCSLQDFKDDSGGEINGYAESQEDVFVGVPAMDEVPLDSTNARDGLVHQSSKRQTPVVDQSLTPPDRLPPYAADIMALSDIFQSELLFVIKELINTAQLEIAKVVISCGERNVSMTTEDSNNTKLLPTREDQKNDMILISSILEMFGRETIRKLSRIFTECCAALQKECKQTKQENNSLKRRLKNMQKMPKKKVNIKERPLALRKANSSSRCTQKDSHLTAPAAPSTPSTGLPPLTSPLLMSAATFQKDETLGMGSSTQHNGLDTDCSLQDFQDDSGGEMNGYESKEDVSGGVPAMDEVPLDSTNVRGGPVHQWSKRQTLLVDLRLTPPDLLPPSPEQKSTHNEHLNDTNQQTANIKPENTHSCDQCEKKYCSLKALLKHKVLHDRNSQQNPITQEVREYRCDICDKVCTNLRSLQSHQLMHVEMKPFMCITCGKCFNRLGTLRGHEKRHSGERRYLCDQCPKAFFKLAHLKQHTQIHTGEKPHKCDLCQRSFSQLSNLRRHQIFHAGAKPFACVVCLKGFSQKCHLKLHMQMHGEGEKPFKCEICGKAFVYNFALKNHMLKHEGKFVYRLVNGNPIKCPVCGKFFSNRAVLKNHTMLHSGQKPFKCEVCNKAFIQKISYTQHTRIHTGEKPFNCSMCSKRFRLKQLRDAHMRIHTGEKPHKCQTCGLAFTTYTNWKRHMRVHTGEKPFSCEVCGKRFNQHGHLKTHMQVHTGERPYFCERCGRRFGCHRTLKKHKCVPC
ncbi:zinc finger and BTB domain-containing protein 17-like isoform X3 [Engraulis encrasicolus]|uniref:zinc finger and BTB domain-containing protein 17-like isoform X3 n=1 Tax=Engraulis encrasicolus TaxID=184585 RepID=UPI002FD46B52